MLALSNAYNLIFSSDKEASKKWLKESQSRLKEPVEYGSQSKINVWKQGYEQRVVI